MDPGKEDWGAWTVDVRGKMFQKKSPISTPLSSIILKGFGKKNIDETEKRFSDRCSLDPSEAISIRISSVLVGETTNTR